MRPPEEGSYDPTLELPHSLHASQHVYPTKKLNMVRFLYVYYYPHILGMSFCL